MLFGGSGNIGRCMLINSTVSVIRLEHNGVKGEGTMAGTGVTGDNWDKRGWRSAILGLSQYLGYKSKLFGRSQKE